MKSFHFSVLNILLCVIVLPFFVRAGPEAAVSIDHENHRNPLPLSDVHEGIGQHRQFDLLVDEIVVQQRYVTLWVVCLGERLGGGAVSLKVYLPVCAREVLAPVHLQKLFGTDVLLCFKRCHCSSKTRF